MKRRAIILSAILSVLFLGSPPAQGVMMWEMARFEEGEAGDIVHWLRAEAGPPGAGPNIIGTHNAAVSDDVPLASISASCLLNRYSLEFSEGTTAIFSESFVFNDEWPQAMLEFWIKVAEPQEASVFWTETAGEDANRFNIYLTGTSMGGEFRRGHLVHISSGTRELPLERWVHVGIIRDAVSTQHTYRWFFDGVEDPTMTASVSASGRPDGDGWTIGGRPGYPFRGWIDEVGYGIGRRWNAGGLGGQPVPYHISPDDLLHAAPVSCPWFKRGDANVDGIVTLTDASFTLDYLFRAEGAPLCLDAMDANDSGNVDIADPIATLTFLFHGTVTIPAPGVDTCGPDPTPDRDGDLGCEYSVDSCDTDS